MGNLKRCSRHRTAWIGEQGCTPCFVAKCNLEKIKDIESRFYSWRLSEQQDTDFIWLVKTLKEELCGK